MPPKSQLEVTFDPVADTISYALPSGDLKITSRITAHAGLWEGGVCDLELLMPVESAKVVFDMKYRRVSEVMQRVYRDLALQPSDTTTLAVQITDW